MFISNQKKILTLKMSFNLLSSQLIRKFIKSINKLKFWVIFY